MKKIIFIFVLISIAVFLFANFLKNGAKTNDVFFVATNSNISEILENLTNKKIEIKTVLQPQLCPGSFDISPKTLQMFQNGKIFFANDFEKWAKRLSTQVNVLNTHGNLMILDIRYEATKEIISILSEKFPNQKINKSYLSKLLKLKKIEAKAKKEFFGINVICNEKISDYLTSLGFNVVATYGKKENLTAKQIVEIVNIARRENVKLVADNLQAGKDTGIEIAKSLNAERVVISNFALDNSYKKTYLENIRKIKETIK